MELLEKAIAHCSTKWLRMVMAEKLPELMEATEESQIEQWDLQIKEVLKERGLADTTQRNCWTDIRGAIAALNPKHQSLNIVGLSTEKHIEINNRVNAKVQNRSTKLINHPEAVVALANSLLHSYEWAEVTAALALITGRRCSELLKTAEFTYCSPYSVTFSGATKRKLEPIPLVFEIPTLVESKKVIKAIENIRKWRPTADLSIKEINQKYESKVSLSCDRHFQNLIPSRFGKDNLYTHIFRAVYATIAAHWYCPPTVPVLEFRAAIQGHYFILNEANEEKKRSIATQRHYFDYQIGDGRGNIDGRLGIKLGWPSVRVIEPFKKYVTQESPTTNNQTIVDSLTELSLSQLLKQEDYRIVLASLIGITKLSAGEIIKSGVFQRDIAVENCLLVTHQIDTKQKRIYLPIKAELVAYAIENLRQHPQVQSLRALAPSEINYRVEDIIRADPQLKAIITRISAIEVIPPVSSMVSTDIEMRVNQMCARLEIVGETLSTRLRLLLDRLDEHEQRLAQQQSEREEQALPPQTTTVTDLQLKAIEHLCTSQQLLATALVNLNPQALASTNHNLDRGQSQLLTTDTATIAKIEPPSANNSFSPSELNEPVKVKNSEDIDKSKVEESSSPPPSIRKTRRLSQKGLISRAYIEYLIDEIIKYNNREDVSHEEKWHIGISLLKRLSTVSQRIMYEVLDKQFEKIEEHHRQHQLSATHNHKGKDVIGIEELMTVMSYEEFTKSGFVQWE